MPQSENQGWAFAPGRVENKDYYRACSQSTHGAAETGLGASHRGRGYGPAARALGDYLPRACCHAEVTLLFTHSLTHTEDIQSSGYCTIFRKLNRHDMTAVTEFPVYKDKTHYSSKSPIYL